MKKGGEWCWQKGVRAGRGRVRDAGEKEKGGGGTKGTDRGDATVC